MTSKFLLFFSLVLTIVYCAPIHKYDDAQNFFNTLEFSKIDEDAVIQFCHQPEIGKNAAEVQKLFHKSYDVIISDGENTGTVELLDSAEVFYFQLTTDKTKLVKLLAMCK